MTETPRIDAFTRAYIEAALWSSTAYGSPDEQAADPADAEGNRRGTFDRSFQDCGYSVGDLSPALLAIVVEDCRSFQASPLWQDQILASGVEPSGVSDRDTQGGHDFWLTRNGHGAGFWDGDWPEAAGDALTLLCKRYPGQDWTVGDDGQVYA